MSEEKHRLHVARLVVVALGAGAVVGLCTWMLKRTLGITDPTVGMMISGGIVGCMSVGIMLVVSMALRQGRFRWLLRK